MSGVKQLTGVTCRGVTEDLERLSTVDAQRIARLCAPKLTRAVRQALNAGRTAYGDPRPLGVDGPVTLIKTGKMLRKIGFRADGTRMRSVLGTKYAKYHFHRFSVMPGGDRVYIPVFWRAMIRKVFVEVQEQSRKASRRAA